MKRPLVFKALVGSHNYGLNTETSDKDYKVFTLPTFDDLYCGNFVSESHTSDTEDYTTHDVRKMPHLLKKSNLNFLEVMYSVEQSGDLELVEFFEKHRDRIFLAHPKQFFNASMGMVNQKLKDMTRTSPAREEAIAKLGYDPKSAYAAFRLYGLVLNCQDRLGKEPTDFTPCFKYKGLTQVLMKRVKAGCFDKEFIDDMVSRYEQALVDLDTKNAYYNTPDDEGVDVLLDDFFKNYVKTKMGL